MGYLRNATAIIAHILLLSGCGSDLSRFLLLQGTGGSGKHEHGIASTKNVESLRGFISSQDTSQRLENWVVMLVEDLDDSGAVYTAPIHNGEFELRVVPTGVDLNARSFTIVLLSPDYIVTSVLSIPSELPYTIRQFFRPQSLRLPDLVYRGDIVQFTDTNGIEVTSHLAASIRNDGIPDGTVSLNHMKLLTTDIDLDQDGIPNEVDIDIDGDGVVNLVDSDNDGDASIDLFDHDANGNLIPDYRQRMGDNYFQGGLEFFVIRYHIYWVNNATYTAYVDFQAKAAHPGVITAGGAPSFLGDSHCQGANTRELHDDGQPGDDRVGDGIYGCRILVDSRTPPGHAALTATLAPTGLTEGAMSFPVVLPRLSFGQVSALYDVSTRIITLVGKPFGKGRAFEWNAQLYEVHNGNERLVWVSATATADQHIEIPPSAISNRNGQETRLKVTASTVNIPPMGRVINVHAPPLTIIP